MKQEWKNRIADLEMDLDDHIDRMRSLELRLNIIEMAVAGQDKGPVSLVDEPRELWYPDDSGEWIEWQGGECPVGDDVEVKWLQRGEREGKRYRETTMKAKHVQWKHFLRRADVVAYRIHKPEPQWKTPTWEDLKGGPIEGAQVRDDGEDEWSYVDFLWGICPENVDQPYAAGDGTWAQARIPAN